MRRDNEIMIIPDHVVHLIDHAHVDRLHDPTGDADEVVVMLSGVQLVVLGGFVKVDSHSDFDVAEELERPVDGGETHPGVGFQTELVDLVRRHRLAGVPGQDAEHTFALGGVLETPSTESFLQVDRATPVENSFQLH